MRWISSTLRRTRAASAASDSCSSKPADPSHGALQILNPSEQVQRLLRLTRIDTVLETYYDERQAVESSQPLEPRSGL